MAQYKYMQLQIANTPNDVIKHYHLIDLATPDVYVYWEIQKGMHGLPRAGIIAQKLLEKHYNNMDTVKEKQHPACGNTTHDQSPSP